MGINEGVYTDLGPKRMPSRVTARGLPQLASREGQGAPSGPQGFLADGPKEIKLTSQVTKNVQKIRSAGSIECLNALSQGNL